MHDVIIIGAGMTGAAAAWAAAKRGRSALVLEAGRLHHRRGSSHGTSRIFRTVNESAKYSRMVHRSQGLWREVEQESGTSILRMRGALDFGPTRNVDSLYAAARRSGTDCELLTAEAAQERWPSFRFPTAVIHHREAGTIDPQAAIRAMLDIAIDNGAELRTSTPVLALREEANGVLVETPSGTFRGRTAVIAAGPWLPELFAATFPDVPPPMVTVNEQNVFHFRQRDPEEQWPVFVYKGGLQLFALPSGADGGSEPAIKIGRHNPGKVVTPDRRDGVPTAENREIITRFVEEHVPGLEPTPVGGDACLYTITRNDDFILDRIGSIVVASPCSGQGAKFMPVVGEIIAGLAFENAPADPDFSIPTHAQQPITAAR
ncbi:FAD-dependent oxidoreductase [Gulosibacter sp. 10]|uniref:FAD-dependent oxidoreductase n=1 Tax=Gulosibacter sp. 10 TaxID=1255570 RepID=UPI00097EF5BD|nr:FAD-dependent oxidoreductase [Gulosibacter sp. 10]SJM62676.1 Monomeric sarcosine oxidase [Gulosibacter sp. 10]